MSRAVVLEVPVDLPGLRAEVAALDEQDWVPHFNTREYTGDWSGVALRAVGGDARRLYPDLAHGQPCTDTPLLARCPAVRGVIDALGSPTTAVRFLRLGEGARIHEHRDDLGEDTGEARLHVPVISPPGVAFVVGGEAVPMQAGQVWHCDFREPHSVHNPGPGPRVHLVVDCLLDARLEALIATP